MRRVVVTGIGGITALGDNWPTIQSQLQQGNSAVRRIDDWEKIDGLDCLIAAPVTEFELPPNYTRRRTRTMGRNAKLAVRATELALDSAQLLGSEVLQSGRAGVAYGSSSGSTDALAEMAHILLHHTARKVNATSYVRLMAHTAAANIGMFFKLRGRVIPTISACTASSQSLGFAFENIRAGAQDLMVAGGSEELCPSHVGVFDTLMATSNRNDAPTTTPRPFDADRDGLIVGEGAVTLVLESLEHAQARGAPILAEMTGFATNSDGHHVTRPDQDSMARVMRMALDNARLAASNIDYISAHGTATDTGDLAESHAVMSVFGADTPISSMKGNFGHTLGACGALEAWLAIEMMRAGEFAPTLNLDTVDPDCAPIDYIKNGVRTLDANAVMSNNFAFGGINTSLIFERFRE
ncbi:MAG: beta-ketoacyl-ACP synthase [Pseudomonadota bacterium]